MTRVRPMLLCILSLVACGPAPNQVADQTGISPTVAAALPTDTPSPSPSLTPSPTSVPTPTRTPIPSPTPPAGSDSFVLSIFQPASTNFGYLHDGIQRVHLLDSGGISIPLLDTPFTVQAVSPDAQSLLVSNGSDLYETDLAGSRLTAVAHNFFDHQLGYPAAVYVQPDARQIAFTGGTPPTTEVFLVNRDGSEARRLTGSYALAIAGAYEGLDIYYLAGARAPTTGSFSIYGFQRMSFDGAQRETLPTNDLVFSGSLPAIAYPITIPVIELGIYRHAITLEPLLRSPSLALDIPRPYSPTGSLAFSTSGSLLFVEVTNRGDGLSTYLGLIYSTLDGTLVTQLPDTTSPARRQRWRSTMTAYWSPNDRYMLIRVLTDNYGRAELRFLSLDTMTLSSMSDLLQLGPDNLPSRRLFWLPSFTQQELASGAATATAIARRPQVYVDGLHCVPYSYPNWAPIWAAAGFRLVAGTEPLDQLDLHLYSVLALHQPNSTSPFSPTEVAAVLRYVHDGGSLFLLSEAYWDHSQVANAIAEPLGAHFNDDTIPLDCPGCDDALVRARTATVPSGQHPITEGLAVWDAIYGASTIRILAPSAEPLLVDSDGSPVLVVAHYGLGDAVFLGDFEGIGWEDQLLTNIVAWFAQN